MNRSYRKIAQEQKNIVKRLREGFCDSNIAFNEIPQGDVPGERVDIKEEQIEKVNTLYKEIVRQLPAVLQENPYQRAVLAVCGGSGVGKTGIASLLSHYFRKAGIGCYVMSGDNYSHRLPKYNDAERLHIFREGGIQRMIEDGVYTPENFAVVQKWQKMEDDANPKHLEEAPWFASYLNGGRKGLEEYLGTQREIAFDEVEAIVSAFKDGAEEIWLKRMGREETELWYECVDFREIHILLIEWTHGNSDYYSGVDFPILLNSTPQETLAYRKARNRDGSADSAFTATVLTIEQEMLKKQAGKAKLIMAKSGKLLTYEAYCRLMEESER